MIILAVVALTLSLAPSPNGTPEELTYAPGGRRDPFVPPIGSTGQEGACEGRGLAAFRVSAVALRGLVRTPRGPIAVLLAPDSRSYFAEPGQRLCDATLSAITPEAAVFVETVAEPLREARTRTVVRRLHP